MPLRDYELVDCLNGVQKNTLQGASSLMSEYAQLKNQFGAGTWVLPENAAVMQIQVANKGMGERYAQALRHKLIQFGADASNIKLKANPVGVWIIELDKALLWQQVGRMMMRAELDKYNIVVNSLLNGILKREKPPAAAVNSFNARIDGMLQQAVNGYLIENYPPSPEWFMEHKAEAEIWLQKPYLLPELKQQVEEILKRTQEINILYTVLRNNFKEGDKAVFIYLGSATEPDQHVRVVGTIHPAYFNVLKQTLIQLGVIDPGMQNTSLFLEVKPTRNYQVLNDLHFEEKFRQAYHANLGPIATMEKINALLEDISSNLQHAQEAHRSSDERLSAQKKANRDLEFLVVLTTKGEPNKGFVPLPQWLNESKEKVDVWLKSDYVPHAIKQQLQKLVRPQQFYDRSYLANDPLVQLAIKKLLNIENGVFQQVQVAGGFNTSFEIDKLLEELQKLDREVLAPYQRARKLAVLLKNIQDTQARDSLFGKMLGHLLIDADYNQLLASQRVLPESKLKTAVVVSKSVATQPFAFPAVAATAGVETRAIKSAPAATSLPVSPGAPVPTAAPRSAFSAEVWSQIANIVEHDKKMIAMQHFQDLSAHLQAETLSHLNSEPKLAARFLAQNTDFMQIFLHAPAHIQRIKLNNLPDKIKLIGEVRPRR